MKSRKRLSKRCFFLVVVCLLFCCLFFTSFSFGYSRGHIGGGANPAGIIPGSGGASVNPVVLPQGMGGKFHRPGNNDGPAGIAPGTGGFSGRGSFNGQGNSPKLVGPVSGLGQGGQVSDVQPKHNTGNNDSGGFVANFNGQRTYLSRPGSNVFIKLNSHNQNLINSVTGHTRRSGGIALGAGDSFAGAINGLEGLTWVAGAKGPNPGHGNTHIKIRKDGDPGNPGGGNGNGHWNEGNHGNGVGNVASGNQGRGVGEGMAGIRCHGDNDNDNDLDCDMDIDLDMDIDHDMDCDLDIDLDMDIDHDMDCDLDIDLDNDIDLDFDTDCDIDIDIDTDIDTDLSLPAAIVPLIRVPEVEGCPAAMAAASREIGIPRQTIYIWISRSLASGTSLQPCDACTRLMAAAEVLRDADGSYFASLAEVVNSAAPADVPFTAETGMMIAAAFEQRLDDDQAYAKASKYLDAFAEYISIMENELRAPVEEPVLFVMDKYGKPVQESANQNIAAYLAMRLEALGG